mgnify:CR=1 FL=1
MKLTNKIKNKNVIWVVVDCVRNYQSGTDDRDKLDVMYELENEFTSFSNMIVSAPSSIMSALSFLTGISAYYLAGNYSQFQFDKSSYWSITDILKHYNYKNYSILNSLDLRTMLTDLIDPVDNIFLTKEVRPTMLRWPNSEVTKIFDNLMESVPEDPSFYFLWYNTRLDPYMSKELEGLINNIKSRDMFNESVIIITADHGYPDRKRGLVSDGWDLMKAGIPHDIIVTNDNIKVPFLIKYPGMKPQKVDELVSAEDILPTLLDILDIELPFQKKLPIFGKSLVPLINGETSEFFENRMVRSDARFALQLNRVTSFQRKNFHYIIQHHGMKEQLYDTFLDPDEVNNIAKEPKNKDLILEFREHFITESKKILKLQKDTSLEKLLVSLRENYNYFSTTESCYVIAFSQSYLYQVAIQALKLEFPRIQITLVIEDLNRNEVEENIELDGVEIVFSDKKSLDRNFNTFPKKDFIVEVVDDPASPEFKRLYSLFKSIRSKKIFRIDWSGNLFEIKSRFFESPKISHYRIVLNKIVLRLKLGVHEPQYFIDEVKRVSKKLLKKNNR